MKSDFTLAFNEIVETRALPREIVLEALAQALVSAYKRDANIGNNQRVEAKVDLTGQTEILLEKEVVDEVQTDQTEVAIQDAQRYYPDIQMGDMVMMPVKTGSNFGRIAAQTAKQVILQRIREAERETLYDEFAEREGDLITGTVQSVTHNSITVSLGRAEAVMPRKEQIAGERYRPHDKVRAYVAEVRKNTRGPQIVVSRAHKNMLRRLLEYEVPEIYNGQVEIKNIAREAGARSKVAVAALQEGVDPVGACVGMRGIRIQNIVKELSDEKIDVIEWSPDPAVFIGKALSPARVSDMLLEDDFDIGRTATVIVPDDQLSLAIGREGQNARLAAKLTGWRIDIKSVSESALDTFSRLDRPPLDALAEEHPAMIAEITRIMDKKQAGRPIQPEEFKVLTEFVSLAERRLLDERESGRAGRREAMDVVRKIVPDSAFQMQIEELELDEDINRALSRLDNVGELMIRLLADEDGLQRVLKQGGAGDDAMEAIRYALDDLVVLREASAAARTPSQDEPAPEPEAVETAETAEAAPAAELAPALVDDEDAALIPAFVDDEVEEVKPVKPAAPTEPDFRKDEHRKVAEPEEAAEVEDEDEVERK
ncbi:MAG: transcription termination/antitermination protein NusA, partial [Chloroflexi bacterium]